MSKRYEAPATTSSTTPDAAPIAAWRQRYWPFPLSLVVQQIGSGALLIFALGLLLDLLPFQLTTLVFSVGALWVGMALGAILQRNSAAGDSVTTERESVRRWRMRNRYLMWGTVLITGIWCGLEIAAAQEWMATIDVEEWRSGLVWLATGLGMVTVGLPSFVLVQEKKYALWRNPLWPVHCTVQALYGGSGLFLLLNGVLDEWGLERIGLANGMGPYAETTFGLLLFVNLLLTLVSAIEFLRETEAAWKSVYSIVRGPLRDIYWWGCIGLGHAVPLGLLMLDHGLITVQAPLYAWLGLFFFQYAYLLAPKTVEAYEQ